MSYMLATGDWEAWLGHTHGYICLTSSVNTSSGRRGLATWGPSSSLLTTHRDGEVSPPEGMG